MRAEIEHVNQKPDLGPLARHLLERILEDMKDPDIQAEFAEWKKKHAEE